MKYDSRLPGRRCVLKSIAGLGAASAIRASAAENALPASIAALQSMRSEAKPITRAERQARIERARALMAEQGMSAMMLAGGTSLAYFTGVHWGNSERLFAAVIPAKGK